MTCDEVKILLHAHLDNELDLPTALRIESHLSACPDCGTAMESAQQVSAAVRESAPYYRASAGLREQVRRSLRAGRGNASASPEPRERPRAWRPAAWRPAAWLAVAAGFIAAAIVPAALLLIPTGTNEAAQLLDLHVRSLQANHLVDVESTDRHTVKPWFAGKVDFSPAVVDLASDGFPLVGGRLEYVEHHAAACLVYRHDKHVVNLFVWPGKASGETGSLQGFNYVRFENGGMVCWAVSDLNAAELQNFSTLYRDRSNPTSGK